MSERQSGGIIIIAQHLKQDQVQEDSEMKSTKAILICGLIVSLQFFFVLVFGASRLAIDESEFDFGFIPQQARVSHEFWLKSEGDETLKIVKVIPGCGCTQAPLEKSEIVVGDSARLEIIFNSGRRKGATTKSPKIKSNEGDRTRHVSFTANIVPGLDKTNPLTFNPYIIDLASMGGDQQGQIQFEITNVSEREVTIRLIDLPDELIEIELPDKIEAGATASGVVIMKEAATAAQFEKSFTIEVNDTLGTRFTIPIKSDRQAPGS
jgi:hypothetical protein